MASFVEQRIEFLEKQFAVQPQSPLFIQLAELYLEAGRSKDALRVCDQGIALYPFYSTAHLVKGKALMSLQMISEARRELELVQELIPDSEGVKKLLAELGPAEEETLGAPEAETEAPPAVEEVPPAAPPVEAETSFQQEQYVETGSEESQPAPTMEYEVQEVTQPADESGFPPSEEVTEDAGVFDQPEVMEEVPEIGQPAFEQPTATGDDDPFGLGAPPESAQPEPAAPETEITETADSQPLEEFGTGASYEQFAEQMRSELEGTANTLDLNDYLQRDQEAPAEPPVEPPPATNEIEKLAEKLQNPPKITPVIDLSDKPTPSNSETESTGGGGFVTPTLAEIYAKQGWYEDAINAYKTLAASKPEERERFEKRIAELEELKKSQTR